MRYAIIGAGAVGSTIGGLLHRSGREVVLVARGAHLQAMRRNGLLLQRPDGSDHLPVDIVASIAEARIGEGDAVILAIKGQDSARALEELAACVPASIAVLCAQNGIANEREALRYFGRVYGIAVLMPAILAAPGIVQNPVVPTAGVLDIGCYPSGVDETARQCAADFEAAGFSSRAVGDIMRWKAGKLVQSVATSVDAFFPAGAERDALGQEAAEEARRCLDAAGIDRASAEEMARRRSGVMAWAPIAGADIAPRPSLEQSLERRSGSIETPYFSGEIALLGRLYGVACPVNAALVRLSLRLAREKGMPRSIDAAELRMEIAKTQ